MPNPARFRSSISDATTPEPAQGVKFTRRGFFAGLGMSGAASVLAACSTAEDSAATAGNGGAGDGASIRKIDFDGPHQAGIREDSQNHALLVAFNPVSYTHLTLPTTPYV